MNNLRPSLHLIQDDCHLRLGLRAPHLKGAAHVIQQVSNGPRLRIQNYLLFLLFDS